MRRRYAFSPAQGGLSLIELMIASAVGLLIMLAILTLYLNVSRTNDEMAKSNALIENGRFAVQLLQNDIAHAGFWDTYVSEFDDLTLSAVPTDVPSSLPNPCLAFSTTWDTAYSNRRLGIPLQVYSSLAAMPSTCSTLLPNYKAGTDILVVRHAHTVPTCLSGQTDGCEAEVSGKLYFQASRCGNSTVDAVPYRLAVSGLDLHARDCTTIAPKRRYISDIYYIRDYSVTAGDGIPTLMRSEFDLESGAVKATAPVALIEGVDGFRVDLGVDRVSDAGVDVISDADASRRWTAAVLWADTKNLTSPINRGDGVPDVFVHCSGVCSVAELANVVAVKVSLLMRSLQATPGYQDGKSYTLGSQTLAAANDAFKRHVFSTVVRLNNVSGRRETP